MTDKCGLHGSPWVVSMGLHGWSPWVSTGCLCGWSPQAFVGGLCGWSLPVSVGGLHRWSSWVVWWQGARQLTDWFSGRGEANE